MARESPTPTRSTSSLTPTAKFCCSTCVWTRRCSGAESNFALEPGGSLRQEAPASGTLKNAPNKEEANVTQTAPARSGAASPTVAENIARLVPYSPGKPIEEVERELGI